MSDSPDDSGGFSTTDDGTFGDPTSDPGSIQDYDSWDWKQIMAAINGMSAGTDSSSNESRAKGIADPQSLMDAAGYFLDAQTVLAGIAKSLADQATALAGDNGPWKGDAADAFLDMMNTFSRQVKATVDVLSGGEAGNSVPQQLADNSVNLYNAQTKIADIDSWYADQAVKMGVQPMSNGLIPIHEKPQLVDMMTNDMRAVLKSLAGEYQVTIDSVKNPTPVTNPTDTPPDDTPDVPDPDLSTPQLQAVDPGTPQQFSVPDTTGVDAPTMDALSPMDALAASPAPFGGGTGVGGDAPDLGGADDGLANDALDPAALDRALNPTPFQGGDGVGGGDMPTLTPSAFLGGLGTGTGDGLSPDEKLADENPQAWSDDAAPEDFPGDTGVGGTGALGSPDALGDDAPEAFPGDLAKESGLPGELKTPATLDDALESPGALDDEEAEGFPGGTGTGAGGMPMMPGMGSGGMPATGATDPSDASGLLDSDAEPWTGDPGVADDIGGNGTQAGGEGLDNLPTDDEAEAFPGELGADEEKLAGSGGMPMMPGTGSGGMPATGATD
ncbi:WXG100 family type VII secretion target, partial [Streptomyces sp. ICBB 8177]|uniref:WXG100 family type VII secretion target n=1 Tax=Streptomyces sp. ICBB 8177 TaxID=563922 RepID=UPI0018EE7224